MMVRAAYCHEVEPLNDPARIMAATFSPITIAGAFVLPLIKVGMMEASATRNPSTPRTRSAGSTTELSSMPILQVPTG